jgi:hypothetical protein
VAPNELEIRMEPNRGSSGPTTTSRARESKKMYFQQVAIGWTPGDDTHDGEVDVIAINELGRAEWFDRHPMSTGGFREDLSRVEPGSEQAKLAVLVTFHMLTVRDEVNPQKVHEAFMDINEYRDAVVSDSLVADLPRWALPSLKRELPRRRHGCGPKRSTASHLAYWKDRAEKAT